MWIILPVVLALSDSQVVSPLQLCTGTAIHVDRRYNMRATGDARCSVGDILLQGEDATVTTNSDERVLDVVMTGKARAFRGGDRVSGDRITARMERAGSSWVLARLEVEFSPRWRIVPADPPR